MATLTTWTFSKRHNSTKKPTGGTDHDVQLKGGCDILTPTFLLNHGGIPTFNYMLFGGRYYFVTGIKSVRNDLWEVTGRVDVLATFKSAITGSTQFVLYYSHNNTEISDRRLSTKTTQGTQSANAEFTYFGKGLVNAVSIVGEDHIATYELNATDLKNLISTSFFTELENEIAQVPAIDNSSTPAAISDAGRFIIDLLETAALATTYVGKLSECIRNCYILPITSGAWGGVLEDVFIGKCQAYDNNNTPIKGYVISNADRYLHDSATVQIPWPTSGGSPVSDWRRNAPYTEIYLYIPCIGTIPISPSEVIGQTYIHVDLSLDKLTGDVIINIGDTDKVIYQYQTNVAVNFPIGSVNVDPARVMNAIGSVIGAAASGNPVQGAIDAGLGICNAIDPTPLSIGSNGGAAFLGLIGYTAHKIYCFTVFHDTTVTPSSVSAVRGTPYNGSLALSGVTGYVQTVGGSVDGSMTDTEREEINSLLDGGIYIE